MDLNQGYLFTDHNLGILVEIENFDDTKVDYEGIMDVFCRLLCKEHDKRILAYCKDNIYRLIIQPRIEARWVTYMIQLQKAINHALTLIPADSKCAILTNNNGATHNANILINNLLNMSSDMNITLLNDNELVKLLKESYPGICINERNPYHNNQRLGLTITNPTTIAG